MRLIGPAVCLLLFVACDREPPEPKGVAEDVQWPAPGLVDTMGVNNISEGDTIHSESGLVMIEKTGTFPYSGRESEVFAWEIFARQLRPVKLVIVKFDKNREHFQLVGESETIIPRKVGVNRFVLREPIPIGPRYMYGLIQPEEPAVPFKKILNWKAMLTLQPFERPLMRRDHFTVYGWRYSMRVFWRYLET